MSTKTTNENLVNNSNQSKTGVNVKQFTPKQNYDYVKSQTEGYTDEELLKLLEKMMELIQETCWDGNVGELDDLISYMYDLNDTEEEETDLQGELDYLEEILEEFGDYPFNCESTRNSLLSFRIHDIYELYNKIDELKHELNLI